MDSPVQRPLLEELGQLEYTFTHWHLARERARQALDALSLLARSGADAEAARKALVILDKSGRVEPANELLAAHAAAATRAKAAAFLRHGAARADLPRWVRWRAEP